MRIVVILLAVLLVSCATPKTEPNSFYSGVYVPGNVVIESSGAYRSTASVFAKKDAAVARKAAYARLLLEAKEAGYAYFSVADEDRETVIGMRYTIAGNLFTTAASDAAVYPIDAIKRLLKDLPIRTLREIAAERRRKEAAEAARKRAAAQAVARKQANSTGPVHRTSAGGQVPAAASSAPATPQPDATPAAPAEEGGPVIIMAPQDITGSIRKAANDNRVPAAGAGAGASAVQPEPGYDPSGRPQSVTGIPAGVYLQRN